MLSRANNIEWISDTHHHHQEQQQDQTISSFKTILEVDHDWYTIPNPNSNPNPNPNTNQTPTNDNNNNLILFNQLDSSVSSSPSPSVFNHDPFILPSKHSVFTHSLSNSLDSSFGSASFFTETNHLGSIIGFDDFSSRNDLSGVNVATHFAHFPGDGNNNNSSFTGYNNQEYGNAAAFMNRTSKLLKPLDDSAPPVGSQPTLFQKRVALRSSKMKINSSGEKDKDVMESISIDGGSSGFNYDSDDFTDVNVSKFDDGGKKADLNVNGGFSIGGGGGGGGNGGCGDLKGKKKGLPAKNLMAERRRRKKLNDRLYMLRSVVPKISKMDRASILGDAIDYLKELLQRINDLHNELESTPSSSTLTQTTSFHPLTPTLPNLSPRIKEELCPSSLPSPNGQPARIEVRLREGRAVNIHMFCGRRPGLLLSTMRALDGLGLDIQQAVISCFNGFAMDIFRAEQCKNGQDVHPEQIKALLMDIATFHGSTTVGNCDI